MFNYLTVTLLERFGEMLSFKWHSSKGEEEKARVRQATVTQPAQCKGMTFGFALGNIEAHSAGCQHHSASILHACSNAGKPNAPDHEAHKRAKIRPSSR